MQNITLQQLPNTQADRLIRIQLSNQSSEPFDKMSVELIFPAEYLDDAVLRAAKKAPDNDDRLESLNGVVQINGGTGTWTVWAVASKKSFVTIRLTNGLDAGKKELPGAQWGQGTPTLAIPRKPVTTDFGFSLNYQSFKSPGKSELTNGKLDIHLLPEGSAGNDSVPIVRLWTDQKSPTALDPGTKVRICWQVDGGISGILKGPLPGDAQQMTLMDGDNTTYDLSSGSIYVRVIGSQIYLLQATVKTAGGARVAVERLLILDVTTAGKKAFLHIFPDYMLPYGRVRAYWAAWGVSSATLVGVGKSQRLLPAAGGANRSTEDDQEGEGDKYFRTGEQDADISLQVTLGNKPPETADSRTMHIVPWKDIETEGPFKQVGPVPLGLAVAWSETKNLGKLVGCNYEGIWMTDVGLGDFDTRAARPQKKSGTAEFTPPEVKLKKRLDKVALGEVAEWFGVTALGEGFAALIRPKAGGDLALVRFDLEKKEFSRKTLPGSLRTWMNNQTATVDLLVAGNRLFLRAGIRQPEQCWHSEAWSTEGLNDRDGWRAEPLLTGLPGFRLAVVDEMLYALQPDTGRLLQFVLQPNGQLAGPRMAAPAVDGKGRSVVTTGLPAVVGKVMVVLGSPRQENAQGEQKEPTDWVFSPQTNRWTDACGQGLLPEARACAAYRNTESKRLWVVGGSRLFTLPVANGENLFDHDYIEGNQVLDLPAYFDETATFTFTNQLLFDLLSPEERFQAAGCYPALFSSAAQQLRFASGNAWEALGRNAPASVTLRYRKDDLPGFRLHWQIGTHPDPNIRSILQVTARAAKAGGGVTWTVVTAFLQMTLANGQSSVDVLAQSTVTAATPDVKFVFPLPSVKKTALDRSILSPAVLSKDGKYAYVTNALNDKIWLSQIELATMKETKSVSPWPAKNPDRALNMVATADSNIFVVVANMLWLFDENLNEWPSAVMPLHIEKVNNDVEVVKDYTIMGFAVSSDRKVYLTGGIFMMPRRGDRNWLPKDYLAVVDLTKPLNNRYLPLPDDQYFPQLFWNSPVPMWITKDARKVYAGIRDGNLMVFDTAGPSISYAPALNHEHYCLYISPDGQRMYTISFRNHDPAPSLLKVRPGDLTIEKSLSFEGYPEGGDLSGYGAPRHSGFVGEYHRYVPAADLLEAPNGKDLIVAYGKSIRIIDIASWTVRQTIPLDTGVRLFQVLDGPLHTWKIRAWGRAIESERDWTMKAGSVLYEVLVSRS